MPYCTTADIRAVQGLDDPAAYPDAVLTSAVAQAEALIDTYTGTSFTYKSFTETLDGSGTEVVRLRTLFPRTLTAVTVDGVAQTTTGWHLYDEGLIVRPSGYFTLDYRNVIISGTAGATSTPPAEIVWAARTIAIGFVLQLESRIPDRALSLQNEFGQVQIAQAGGLGRPTEYPAVNAALNRFRHRPPVAF